MTPMPPAPSTLSTRYLPARTSPSRSPTAGFVITCISRLWSQVAARAMRGSIVNSHLTRESGMDLGLNEAVSARLPSGRRTLNGGFLAGLVSGQSRERLKSAVNPHPDSADGGPENLGSLFVAEPLDFDQRKRLAQSLGQSGEMLADTRPELFRTCQILCTREGA